MGHLAGRAVSYKDPPLCVDSLSKSLLLIRKSSWGIWQGITPRDAAILKRVGAMLRFFGRTTAFLQVRLKIACLLLKIACLLLKMACLLLKIAC